MKKVKVSNIKEKAMEIVFLVSACISILSVALICVFLFTNGVPGIAKIGLKEFLLGTEWKPVVWNHVYDHRKYLCYSGSNHCGSANRTADGSLYGKVLSQKAV